MFLLFNLNDRILTQRRKPIKFNLERNPDKYLIRSFRRYCNTMRSFLIFPVLAAMLGTASAGPLAYGICQAGCSALVVSCYAAGGFTFGTITAGVGAPAVVLACNSSFGICQAACAAAILAPTP